MLEAVDYMQVGERLRKNANWRLKILVTLS